VELSHSSRTSSTSNLQDTQSIPVVAVVMPLYCVGVVTTNQTNIWMRVRGVADNAVVAENLKVGIHIKWQAPPGSQQSDISKPSVCQFFNLETVEMDCSTQKSTVHWTLLQLPAGQYLEPNSIITELSLAAYLPSPSDASISTSHNNIEPSSEKWSIFVAECGITQTSTTTLIKEPSKVVRNEFQAQDVLDNQVEDETCWFTLDWNKEIDELVAKHHLEFFNNEFIDRWEVYLNGEWTGVAHLPRWRASVPTGQKRNDVKRGINGEDLLERAYSTVDVEVEIVGYTNYGRELVRLVGPVVFTEGGKVEDGNRKGEKRM
jgi:hypothetical protein